MPTSNPAPRPPLIRLAAALTTVLCTPLLAVGGIVLVAAGGSGRGGQAIPTGLPASTGVPPRAVDAYQRASADGCPGVGWTLLAAIGAVESRHGHTGTATLDDTTGEAHPWIFGPTLNGTAGTAATPAGPWVGWWGLTGPWTQAVGPMQFLPATFVTHAVDLDDDGTTNPHDIDDAAATTAHYLCAAGNGQIDGVREAARIYNPGDPSYADKLAIEQERIQEAASATATATICPVAGPVEFTDTYGAPRSGGRTHKGVDIFADNGTPVVAPADGQLTHFEDPLGGMSYSLEATDGTYYYGTHLSAYENQGASHIPAGTVIGYVGTTGNAAGTPPHLHWQIHPAGKGTPPINPTPTATALCATSLR